MLISDKHQFIFVHVFKNAGTSISRSLRPYSVTGWQSIANPIFKRVGIPQVGTRRFPTHVRASQLIEALGRKKFDSYFSFAFVRNPWDWQVSQYKYILKRKRHPLHLRIKQLGDFSEYLKWRCRRVRLQNDFVSVDGEQVVDFVGRFENIEHDFQEICKRIGVNANLGVRNVTKSQPFQEYYDARSVELVKKTYRQDIELFGYQFDESPGRKIA